MSQQLLVAWSEASRTLSSTLTPAQLFPLVDMWRLALLDDAVGAWCASAGPASPLRVFLTTAATALEGAQTDARNYVLVTLRMLANAFACAALVRTLLAAGAMRALTTRVLVSSLLHADAAVRTAAASVAFDVAAFLQKSRVDQVHGAGAAAALEEDGDWEVELVSAVLEALSGESESEDVGAWRELCTCAVRADSAFLFLPIVHRLTAALAFLLRLSPVYDSQLVSFLEVLQARGTLEGKLQPGGCGEQGVQKKDVRKLVEEVAQKLCP